MFIGARGLVGFGITFQLNAAPLLITELAYPTQEGEAARILTRYHSNGGDEHVPLVVFEMAQIRHAIKLEKKKAASTTFVSLFATPGNRRRMLIVSALAIFSQWRCGIYVLSGALLVDRFGRRTLFIFSNIGMLISFAIWTLTTTLFQIRDNTPAAKATIPFIFIFYLFYDVAYTPMLIAYTLEILPFNIRAKGFAVMNLLVSLTLAFNQFVNPWALDAIGWKYYLVYCGWLVVELIFIVTHIIETRGRTLEETAALFDGKRSSENLVQTAEEVVNESTVRAQEQKVVNGAGQKDLPMEPHGLRVNIVPGERPLGYQLGQEDNSVT
ncbi:hypothetical protein AcV5_008639 [Taiwanofungus camphoratus]|nr:hypothetical protein AcV5_008639 [Antrodia cinnamomea]